MFIYCMFVCVIFSFFSVYFSLLFSEVVYVERNKHVN
jgi:hypothetical protein